MRTGVGPARIGQWYAHRDKGEIFQVVGYDAGSRTIEIQTFDGDLDEMDLDTWAGLPLAHAEPPEDWTGPVDDLERDDLGYSETEMSGGDSTQRLQSVRAEVEEREAWQDTTPDDEAALEATRPEGTPSECFCPDRASPRAGC